VCLCQRRELRSRHALALFDPSDIRSATCPNRGEKFFAHLDEIHTLPWAPNRRILNQTAIGRIVRRPRGLLPMCGLPIAIEDPTLSIAYSATHSVVPNGCRA
jgi:hypothetical protein